MVIQHNMAAMNAQRQFKVNTDVQAKSTEKLSSGFRINRAADDAAGLSISEKMRKQIRGLDRASTNAQDGVSCVQVADGALTEVHDMLQRMNELSIQAANGTNSETDRQSIQDEIDQLSKEIDRVHTTTKFNEIELFPSNGHEPDEVANLTQRISLDINGRQIELFYVGNAGAPVTPTSSASGTSTSYDPAFSNYVVSAAAYAINKLGSIYPDMFNASSDGVKIGLNAAPIDGKGGVLASATTGAAWNSSNYTGLNYTLNIDTSDYNVSTFASWTAEEKQNLASTIAHEMTHLVMYDTMTSKMMGIGSSFPTWFVEGMAQTASGDGGWVPSNLYGGSDATIKSYMAQASSTPYGAGYLAVLTMGYEAAKASGLGTSYTSSTIRAGLNKILGNMTAQSISKNPIDSDTALSDATGGKFSTFSSFLGAFESGRSDLLNDVKNIVNATGAGAGSLFDDLSKTTAQLFSSPVASPAKYAIDPSNTSFNNVYAAGMINAAENRVGTSLEEGGDIILQVGADAGGGNQLGIMRFNMSATSIFGGKDVNVKTQDYARESIDTIGKAISRVSAVRSYYGAIQNRLDHTIKNLDNVVENTTAAESRIRDTDMADEMVKYSKNNILLQAGQSMISQANSQPNGVLSLLQ